LWDFDLEDLELEEEEEEDEEEDLLFFLCLYEHASNESIA